MAYTVKKLSELSGVTVRTLHHYDEIGLLKPAYYGGNNYRYYEEEQLLLLQQILFYRKLGMPLEEIRRILTSSDFQLLTALNSHRKVLQKDLNRTSLLIETIDKTISHIRGKIKMKDKEFFYGLDSPRQKQYEKELVEMGLVTKADLARSRGKVTEEQLKKWQEKGDALNKDFVQALEKKLSIDCVEVQKLAQQHYELIKFFWTPNKQKYLGLAELYHRPDFREFYNHYHPQLLDYLTDAMKVFAESHFTES